MSTTTETAAGVAATETPQTFTVNEPDLRDALSAALLSASTDYTLPVLCAVKLERKGDQLVIWSTDKYRLTRVTIASSETEPTPGPDFDVLVDVKDVKRIIATLQKRTARGSYAMPATITVESVPNSTERTVTVATLGGRTTVPACPDYMTYPSVATVLEQDREQVTERTEICFNPRFMTDLCKMPGRGKGTVHVRFTGPKGLKMRASWEDGSVSYEYLLMLARPVGESAT